MIHLLKLCVGCESVEDLVAWHRTHPSPFPTGERRHVTRMWPRRETEILEGGSLYWVIKGLVLCRQRIVRLDPVEKNGLPHCGIVMEPEVIRTEAQPRRAFQGWRYLEPKDAPRDLRAGRAAEAALPKELVSALALIGLR